MDPLDPFSASSSSSARIFVGQVVVDDEGADVPFLVVEALEQTAEEYVLSSPIDGPPVTYHDRIERVPPDDPLYMVLAGSIIRRSFPEWHEGDTREVLASYRSGSFRQAAKVRAESILTPIAELGIDDLAELETDETDEEPEN